MRWRNKPAASETSDSHAIQHSFDYMGIARLWQKVLGAVAWLLGKDENAIDAALDGNCWKEAESPYAERKR